MDKKKNTKIRTKKRVVKQPLSLISPDGGETVYEQNRNGTRGEMISQSQYAKDVETLQDEAEMVGTDAVKIRREYPTLQKAWDKYRTIWHLINDNEQ